MKKVIFVFLPLAVIVLTSCKFELASDNGSYSIYQPSSTEISSQNIVYFDGDTFNDTDYSANYTIDCTNKNVNSGAYYQDTQSLLAAMNQVASDSESSSIIPIISSIDQMTYVGRGAGGVLIGYPIERYNGVLKFTLANGLVAKAIRVVASPRANNYTDWEDGVEKLDIDECAISINGSNYIKLDDTADTLASIEDTVCSVILPIEGSNQITISVYGEQAIIHSIIIYN